jgi:multidrug efflux pump subunit AcrA (membrane-fusion protein)
MQISRSSLSVLAAAAALAAAAVATACSTPSASANTPAAAPEPTAITTAPVESLSIDRFLRVTGSLVADEQAEVSAEVSGRVVGTPVERGTRVAAGAALVTISAIQASAQLTEADANAAQIEARLGLAPGQAFDPLRVPDVMNAKASLDLATAEFARIQSLLDQKVVSQSEYDQRRMQVEAARQQYQMAQNAAEQSLRALDAARARVTLARKAMADTTVRAPFAGLVVERLVSVGDFVSAGTRVATVVRIDPVRVELTVPERAVALIKDGQPVRLSVDAYPGEQFVAQLRHISPALRADQRALTVEAVATNPDGRLKPGLFATAAIQLPVGQPALLVPATAVETVSGTSRVYVVVNGDNVQERIVTIGETVGSRVEVTSGLSGGEVVAAEPKGRLTDGAAVRVR